MNRKAFYRAVSVSIALFVLIFSVEGVIGQGPGPGQESQPPAVTGVEDAVGSRISYQGVLKEDSTPVTGNRDMIFRLHKDSACTSQVGSDIVKNGVEVAAGLFSVTLDVTQSDFDGQGLWLQVLVSGVPLSCREITAVPYALSLRPGALISDTLAGPVLKLFNSSSAAGIQSLVGGGTVADIHPAFYNAAGEFAGPNGVIGAASDYSTDGYGVIGVAQGSSGRGVYGYAFAGSGANYGVYGLSESTSGRGVYGEASAASGTTYGGRFESDSTSGRGVYGLTNAITGTNYGGIFESNSDSGTGVRGFADASTGTTYGVYGLADSTAGTGVYGYANAGSGATYGVYGRSASASGYGVLGTAPTNGVRGYATSTGANSYGVYGDSDSLNNTAAGGRFIAGTTASTSQSDGVLGLAYGQNTSAFGVAGWAYYQGVGVGAWSYSGNIMEGYDGDYPGGTRRMYLTQAGNLYIDGTYNTFVMGQDGSKQVLYGTQSTEVWVEDYGTATLAEGRATVKIAADFAETVNLGNDYHVFLTPMGDCALYVAEKTAASFTVRAIGGQACSIAFDYRIVAKQAGLENYRMTEIASPDEPAKTEPAPEALPPAPPPEPEPEPSQPVSEQSVP